MKPNAEKWDLHKYETLFRKWFFHRASLKTEQDRNKYFIQRGWDFVILFLGVPDFKRFVPLWKIPKFFQKPSKMTKISKFCQNLKLKKWVDKWANFMSRTIMIILRNSTILAFSKMIIPHEHPFQLDNFERNWDIHDGPSDSKILSGSSQKVIQIKKAPFYRSMQIFTRNIFEWSMTAIMTHNWWAMNNDPWVKNLIYCYVGYSSWTRNNLRIIWYT